MNNVVNQAYNQLSNQMEKVWFQTGIRVVDSVRLEVLTQVREHVYQINDQVKSCILNQVVECI